MRWLWSLFFFVFSVFLVPAAWALHGYSHFGELKYAQGFRHFDYANENAPKGGSIRFPIIGEQFDKLNPFTLKGSEPPGLESLLVETLLVRSLDEPASAYGLLASDVSVAADRRSVIFKIRPQARFHNGDPVLAQDVKYSFDKLKSKEAAPVYNFYFSRVLSARVIDDYTIEFAFAEPNRELPLIVGSLPVFSRKWGQGKPLDQIINEAPIGSGPYRMGRMHQGKDIEYLRDRQYWAEQLNVRLGMYYFDRISFDAFKDPVAAFEAFKSDQFDFTQVFIAKDWARKYKGGRFAKQELIKSEWSHSNPVGYQGFVFNTRLPKFADARVRQAIGLALDFEWMNRQIFYLAYSRVKGYFTHSEYEAKALPQQDELAFLKRLPHQPAPDIYNQPVPVPPQTLPPDSLRSNLRKARDLFEQAGWHYREGALRNQQGEAFSLEFLDGSSTMERVVTPYINTLKKLGIQASYRRVDPSVYEQRRKKFNFEIVSSRTLGQLIPGSELSQLFDSQTAQIEGTANTAGVSDPVVDDILKYIGSAQSRDELRVAVTALDRVLRHGYYDVPHWYSPVHRVAYKAGWFEQAPVTPLYYQPEPWAFSTWWASPANRKQAMLH
jgi:microcin C transport system substrate-binding protein